MNSPPAKNILVTAGQVYGRLDDNKLVGNRVRGIWATKFARWLSERNYSVTLLIPDTMAGTTAEVLDGLPPGAILDVVQQRGYEDYAAKCYKFAQTHDAAVMAAAVVNWIPLNPVKGKMPTKGYEEGEVIQVPFVLAPRVINKMRVLNPKLTLIGCKMLIGSTSEELVDAAYHVSLTAKCNVVVANDMKAGLRTKKLVYPDRTVQVYEDDFTGFFEALRDVIEDEHWHSEEVPEGERENLTWDEGPKNLETFDRIVEKYRDRFSPRGDGKVFGSLLIPIRNGYAGYLSTPREKGAMFSSKDAVWVRGLQEGIRGIEVSPNTRATMNAPLLIRFAQYVRIQRRRGMMYGGKEPVLLHLHEQLPGFETLPYGPPGTDRDILRALPDGVTGFNIEGHGFVAALDPVTLEILK